MSTFYDMEQRLHEVESRRKRLGDELREVNEKLETKSGGAGLKERGANLVVALNRADAEYAEARKAWESEVFAGIDSGAYVIESGDGAGTPVTYSTATRSGTTSGSIKADINQWADDTAKVILETGKKVGFKALAAGSFDRPQMVSTGLFAMPANPARLLDLIVDRRSVPGNEYEFLRQTTRTDNAAAVADNAEKPESVYTVTSQQDRVRVYAHLSEPVPNRILADHQDIKMFLQSEMTRGVLDALEADIVSGAAAQENVVGILNTANVQTQAFVTDIPTTLRKAYTAMVTAHEDVTSWVLNPAEAEVLDLTTTADGQFIVDSSAYANIFKNVPVLVTTSVPAGTAILADWRMSTLYVRASTRLDADSSGTLFTHNQTMFRAEGRFGWAVNRPAAFNVIDLTV
jgi:HK97 family phage major capsid protein